MQIVDSDTLQKVEEIKSGLTMVLVAVFYGSVRLIDNIELWHDILNRYTRAFYLRVTGWSDECNRQKESLLFRQPSSFILTSLSLGYNSCKWMLSIGSSADLVDLNKENHHRSAEQVFFRLLSGVSQYTGVAKCTEISYTCIWSPLEAQLELSLDEQGDN